MNEVKQNILFSIIIVNYDLAKEIDNCLQSLLQMLDQIRDFSYEIIIVDNNSHDREIFTLENKYARNNIKFYYLENNVGFGKGCNYGFAKAKGKYICFLNPDTIIKGNIFTKVVDIFEKDRSIGIIGPQQQVRAPFFDFSAGFSPNIFFEILGIFGISVFAEGFLMHLYKKYTRKEFITVNWILGASIFIKAELFNMIGGFDKDYFLFYEEVDLCKRVSKMGYKILYVPTLAIHHIGSVSGKKNYYLYTIRTYSSKYIYISKHFSLALKILMIFFLYTQLFTQILIWIILLPISKEKAKQKIKAFVYLLLNRMKNKLDIQSY